MSEELIDSVYDRDPDQALLDLERFELSTSTIASFSLFRGPFGVSKLARSPETENTSPEEEEEEEEESILPIEDWLIEPSSLSPTAVEAGYFGLFNGFHDVLDDDQVSWGLISSEIKESEESFRSPQPQLEFLPISLNGNTEAWPLLSHYRDRVVPLISPFEHGQEVPWKNLVVPCAVSTLGETIMSGIASHARLALLNSLLSASSFHLGQHSATCIDHWIETGNSYLKLAQHHLIQCVEEASMSPPKQSKYKEVLMALLSLSTAYVCIGNRCDTGIVRES
jgi:arginine metabolism regulation protein II